MIQETTKAYFAGLFDGEGCVLVSQQSSLLVEIAMSDKLPLTTLLDIYGGSVGAYKKSASIKTVYQYTLAGREALNFLEDILPYSLNKRPQIELALTFPVGTHGRKVLDSDLILRDSIYLKLKELKQIPVNV